MKNTSAQRLFLNHLLFLLFPFSTTSLILNESKNNANITAAKKINKNLNASTKSKRPEIVFAKNCPVSMAVFRGP